MLKGTKGLFSVICLVSLIIIISIIVYANTTVHLLGYSAVDNGEIRWVSTTGYTTERDFAINLWNAENEVDVLADDWYTDADLIFLDCDEDAVEWTGRYVPVYFLDDEIQLNKFYLEDFSVVKRKKTVSHELGHALGIGDHYDGYSLCIMYGISSEQNSLSVHDKADYAEIY